MKKKILLSFMIVIFIMNITACKASNNFSKTEKPKESASVTEEVLNNSLETEETKVNGSETEANTVTNEPSISEQEEYDMISKYIDTKEYEDDYGSIVNRDNKTDKDISFITVDDTKFKIGMTYDDILSLGYKPEDESFADKKPNSLVVLNNFINDKENNVHFGFALSNKSDRDGTVSDGSFLYEIIANVENNKFYIDDITEDSTISNIINIFGNPYRIDSGMYSDFPDAVLLYESAEYSQYITFCVNLETEKIVSVKIEGYTD